MSQTKPVVDPALAHDYLVRALQLLEQPRRHPKTNEVVKPNSWIVNREAIDSYGNTIAPESEQAVAWCTVGVVKAVTKYDPDPNAAYKYICSLLDASPVVLAHDMLERSNDTAQSFERVRKTFLRAIKLTEKWLTAS